MPATNARQVGKRAQGQGMSFGFFRMGVKLKLYNTDNQLIFFLVFISFENIIILTLRENKCFKSISHNILS